MKFARMLTISLVALSISANAWALGKGVSLLGLSVGGGQADWVQPAGGSAGYLTSQFQLPELRGTVDFWRMLTDDYALNLSGGIGWFSETDKPGTAAFPNAPDQKSSISDFRVRIGGDRVFKVGERGEFYLGTGIFYGSGKFKYESGTTSDESPTVTRYGLDGRVGGMAWMSQAVGMQGRVGHTFGMDSAEDDGAKSTWTSNAMYAECGLVFVFGGR